MMYDKSNGGAHFRKYCGVSLGWWHTYKHVALKIWTVFADTVWAPLFHHLYPGTTFYPKMKNLTHVLAMYQCCMVSYRDLVDEARKAVDDLTFRPAARVAMQDLVFVIDYALPVVIAQLHFLHSEFYICKILE
jgi:hypothetical protein